MSLSIFAGIMLPFAGTVIGALGVFGVGKKYTGKAKELFTGFAAGIMIAASIWSLILPAFEMTAHLGKLSVLPVIAGLGFGTIFLIFSQMLINTVTKKRQQEILSGKLAFILAVVLHNIPEGIAVGVAFSSLVSQNSGIDFSQALILSLGIALQNIPEGAIISLPLAAENKSRPVSFVYGALSGAVEPVFAFLAILFSYIASRVLPFLLAFAAGAMIFVTVTELIPEAVENKENSTCGALAVILGFCVMMLLDTLF